MKQLSKETLCCASCWLFVLFAICTAIGIPCIVYGCNSSYVQCVKWDFKDMAVVKVGAQKNQALVCNVWINVNKIMTCSSYRNVVYYTPLVYFETCTYSDSSEFNDGAAAANYGNAVYPVGTVLQLAVSRDNPAVCERPGGLVKNLAIVGLVFGPLACIFAVAFICTYFLYICKKEIDTLPQMQTTRRVAVLV